MTVRIGIDFGTAFTKVAIQAGRDLILVDWSAVTGDDTAVGRYVVPGFVCRARDDDYGWHGDEQSEVLGNLKLTVIEDTTPPDCPMATVAFLALVIRYSRAYLYGHRDVGRKLVDRTLRWELNIGCPTEPHENPEIVNEFRRIASAAWSLASTPALRATDIAAAWRDSRRLDGLEAEPGVLPEFVAQIAGYLRSPQVNEGLHALVDIGAATLDVATFNVVFPRDDDHLPRIPIFFSAVKPLGTHYLYWNRYERLDLEPDWRDDIPVEGAAEFAARVGRSRKEIERIDMEFVARVSLITLSVIDGTRTNRYGDPGSDAWKEGLPIFVTGGGASCDSYRHALGIVEKEIRSRIGTNSRFRLIEQDSLGVASELFGREAALRTSVAIGLTEDAESIGRVVPHRDVGPITYVKREQPDHTELYED